MVQQTSARHWYFQEVAHVKQGIRTVIQSHSFEEINLCGKAIEVLMTNLRKKSNEHEDAFTCSRWVLYLKQADQFLKADIHEEHQTTLHQHNFITGPSNSRSKRD
eukprot:3543454-Pleurochrysis_carterae.AAC.1